jgi:hypothetical protein
VGEIVAMTTEQLDLEDFLRRGQAAQDSVNRILQKSDQVARTRPRARGTDPQTSHKAAKRAREGLTQKQQAVLDLFEYMELLNRGTHQTKVRMTDPQMIAKYNSFREQRGWPAQSDSGLRTRRHELTEMKPAKIVKVGEQERTKGKSFTLWGLA